MTILVNVITRYNHYNGTNKAHMNFEFFYHDLFNNKLELILSLRVSRDAYIV